MKTRILLVLIVSIFVAKHALAYDFKKDGIFYDVTSSALRSVAVTFEDSTYNSYRGDVTIPSTVSNAGRVYTVTSIGEKAFWSCIGLTSITIPSSVSSIESSAFSGCSGLTFVDIPSSVTSIGEFAFWCCTGLTSIILPESVRLIGEYAFRNCYRLTSITIPSSVITILDGAFYDCTGLASICTVAENPIDLTGSFSVFYSVDKTGCILYVPAGSQSLYQSADQWKDFSNIVEDGYNSLDLTVIEPLILSPNVANNYFRVDNLERPAKISVYNISGQSIFHQTIQPNELIRVSDWEKGIYIVKMNNTTAKLMVN